MLGGAIAALEKLGRSAAASRLALGAFVASLALAALLPVYTDEIVWRFHERAWLDGGYDVWMNDACGPNTIAQAPWFMMPVRWFSATLNLAFPAPLYVRLTGVACALLWLGLAWRIAGRAIADPQRRATVRTLTLALLGLGVTPYLMVLSRPEQPLILAVSAMVLMALAPTRSTFRAWLRCAAIAALTLIALSYHPKGVLYAPVAAVCLVFCARGRNTLAARVTALVGSAALTLVAAQYWTHRFACPEDPELAARFAPMNLAGALDGGHGLAETLATRMLHATPFSYIKLAAPPASPISDWLPPERFALWEDWFFRFAMAGAWTVALLVTAAALWRSRLRKGHDPVRRSFALVRVGPAATILACLLVWGFGQATKNMYEAAHVLPLLAVGLVLLSGVVTKEDAQIEGILPVVAAIMLAVTVASQLFVSIRLAPAFLAAAGQTGFVEEQPYSVSLSIAGQRQSERDIDRAMARVGIRADSSAFRLVVDEATYLSLQRTRLPLLSAGVFGGWKGSRQPWWSYLASRNSSGVVVDCRSLPAELSRAAVRYGTICALGRRELSRLQIGPHA